MRFLLIRFSRLCVMACQLAIKEILRNISLLIVRLPGLLPRVDCIPALIACIAMENASSVYSLVLSIFWGGPAPVNSVSWQGVILYVGFCQTSKQANNQTNKKYNLGIWFGILAWVLGLLSWLGFLTLDLGLGPWLQTDMIIHELELSMVLLDPLHILQMELNKESISLAV